MNDLIDGARVTTGEIRIDGVNIYDPRVDVIELRKRVGMVFQKSNPFPKSIYENVVYGMRVAGINSKAALDQAAEEALRAPTMASTGRSRPPRCPLTAIRGGAGSVSAKGLG